VTRNAPPDRSIGNAIARVGGAAVLLGGTVLVLRPFIVPVIWAGILAYVTWPLYRAVRRRTRRPRISAALFTLATAVVIAVPVAWLLVRLANEATDGIAVLRAWLEAGAQFPAWIAERPWLVTRLESVRDDLIVQPSEIVRYATTYAANASGQLVSIAGGLASNAFKLLITLTALFFFYLDGEALLEHARRLGGVIFPQAGESLLPRIGAIVRAVVFGLLGTAIAQGILAGIGFWLFGVPSPVGLGALTTVASFIPMGPVLIWGAAAAWLFMGSHVGAAVGMAVWGVLLVSTADNVLRPILIGGTTRIPFLLVFFGVLGGLMAFGVLGLFVGPVLLSVTFALIADFAQRTERVELA
jgi:predicted PurR-regulated permease PerM